jgi:hypothetical protein
MQGHRIRHCQTSDFWPTRNFNYLAQLETGFLDMLEDLLYYIRSREWAVAVHNDYKLDGINHTFWLFTHEGTEGTGRFVKGEGQTDTEALHQVLKQI